MTDPGKGPAIQLFGKEGGKNIQLKKETVNCLDLGEMQILNSGSTRC